eukprot:gene18714-26467_t
MGIIQRVENLLNSSASDEMTDEQAEFLISSLQRLIDPKDMGKRYKVMAIHSINLENKLVPFISDDNNDNK